MLPIIQWPDLYTLFQKRPSSCLTECQSNNVCGLYSVAFHTQPKNLVCLCYCCQMFCGWFSSILWGMSPCQWISANLSNFEMIPFSTWLYSSQTKLCSHLKLPCFGYPFFTLNHYLLPVSLQEPVSIGLPLHQAPFQMVLEIPSEESSSESLGNSYIVFNTQATWIGSKGNMRLFS